MALPSTGPLSASAINTELGRSATAQFSFESGATGGHGTINVNSTPRPNSTTPHALSEWYGYNHTALPPLTLLNLGYNASDDQLACSAFTSAYYIATANLSVGDPIYLDVNGSSLAPAGWYSDGAITYNFNGSIVTATGLCGGGM